MLLEMILQGVITTLVLVPSVHLFQFIQNKRKLNKLSKLLSEHVPHEHTHYDKTETHKIH